MYICGGRVFIRFPVGSVGLHQVASVRRCRCRRRKVALQSVISLFFHYFHYAKDQRRVDGRPGWSASRAGRGGGSSGERRRCSRKQSALHKSALFPYFFSRRPSKYRPDGDVAGVGACPARQGLLRRPSARQSGRRCGRSASRVIDRRRRQRPCSPRCLC